MDAIKAVFEEGGFPGVVGVIDGTHISVRAPTEDSDAYINRKEFYSLQLQVLKIFLCHTEQILFTLHYLRCVKVGPITVKRIRLLLNDLNFSFYNDL